MKNALLVFTFLFASSLLSAQSSFIAGKVSEVPDNNPLGYITVVLQGTSLGATTDTLGNFKIPSVPPGLYNVECIALGYKKFIAFEVEVTVDRPAFINIQLEPEVLQTGTVEISSSNISSIEEAPLSVRSIGTNEIKRNPGGNRDISRVIRTLPGVAAIPSFRNDIVIRGGAPNENRFYIDGIEIPNINHFATQGASGGPVGMINVDLIREVELYTGSFPAARGNALSSVMEFEFRDPRLDKYTANFVVGSSDLGVTIDGPTGKNSGILLTVRRSYLQGLFSLLQLPFLPTYNDYNLKWKWDINAKNKLTVISLGALDQFQLNLKLDDDTTSENFERNKYLLDNLVVNNQWNYSFGVKWDHYLDKSRISVIASRNMLRNTAYKYLKNDETLPKTFDYSSTEQENKLRIEQKFFGEHWKLLYGAGMEYALYDNHSFFQVPLPSADTTLLAEYSNDFKMLKYYSFIQGSTQIGKAVLSAGVRADGNDFNEHMGNLVNQVSPRLALRYNITRQLSFNAGTGIYFQQPSYIALGFVENQVKVNRAMKFIRNRQVSGGLQYAFEQRNAVVSAEGFYKYYDQYPISVSKGVSLANLGADFGTVGNEALVSDGRGRSYGLELMAQQKLYKGFYGILAYTYVHSEFTGMTGEWRPSSWDSRHLVSVTAGKKFGKNWEVGGVFRYSGGLPYTPDNVNYSMLIPVWDALRVATPDWSRLNSQRISPFHQLDVRIDKKWFFTRWSLDLFLDIQNVYGSSTPLKPSLDVQRDPLGNPVVDPNQPNRYLPNFIDESTGTVLPSIGIILEL
jgi:hypothetical protein